MDLEQNSTVGPLAAPPPVSTGQAQFRATRVQEQLPASEDRPAESQGDPSFGNIYLNADLEMTLTYTSGLSESRPATSLYTDPTTAREVVEQIAARVDAESADRAATIEIQLSPPELGVVRLRLVTENDLLTARIEVANREIQAMVESGLPELKDQLLEQGVQVQSFDVSCHSGAHSDAEQFSNMFRQTLDTNSLDTESAPAVPQEPGESRIVNHHPNSRRLDYLA